MIKAIIISLALLGVGGFAGFQLASISSVSDEKDIRFTEQWRKAYEANDFVALEDLYAPDAWLMSQGQPARKGTKNIINYLEALRASGMSADVITADEELIIDGDYAFSTTKWWHELPFENGELMRNSGRSFVVFKRGDDGKWRLWRAIKHETPDVNFEDMPQ